MIISKACKIFTLLWLILIAQTIPAFSTETEKRLCGPKALTAGDLTLRFDCAREMDADGVKFDDRYAVIQGILQNAREILPQNDVTIARILLLMSFLDLDKGNAKQGKHYTEEALNIFAAHKDHTSPHYAHALLARASAETGLGDFAPAEKDFLAARKILENNSDPEAVKLLPTLYFQLGIHKASRGLFAEGAAFMGKAYDAIIKTNPDDFLVANAALAEAGMLSSARAPEAEEKARRAVETARRIMGPTHTEFATSLEVLGIELQRQGRMREAGDILIKAVAIKKANLGMSNMRLGYALHNLATLKNDLGEVDAGLALMEDARTIFLNTVGPDNFITINSQMGIARSHEAMGHDEIALKEKERRHVVKAFEKILEKNHRDIYFARMGLIQSLIGAKDYREAMAQAELGWQVVSTLPDDHIHRTYFQILLGYTKILNGLTREGWSMVTTGLHRLKFEVTQVRILEKGGKISRFYSGAFKYVLAAAYEMDKPDVGFDVAQYLMETELAGAAGAVTQRLSEKDPAFAKKHKTLSDKRAALREDTATYQKNIADGTDKETILAELEQHAITIKTLENDLEKAYPRWSQSENLPIASRKEAQNKLARNETILLTLNTLHYVYSIALTKDRIAFDRTKIHQVDVRAKIRNIRRSLSQNPLLIQGKGKKDPDFDLKSSYDLYQIIFSRKIRKATGKTNHLFVISNATFSSLPFSLLVTKKTAGRNMTKKLKKAKWLIRDMAIQRLASIGTFRAVSGRDTPKKQQMFIGIGAPSLLKDNAAVSETSDGYYRNGQANRDALRSLSALPGAQAELDQLHDFYGKEKSQLFTGKTATERAIKQIDFDNAHLVVFATHGLISGQFGTLTEPALVLTPPDKVTGQDDGLLTASEISLMSIPAEWVILSACNTAAGNSVGAAGFTGLGRAFIYAGAKAVLLSHWPIRDDIAGRISTGSIAYARTAKDKAEALRLAILDIMKDRTLDYGYHPLLWAPFELLER
ncbi:MAG: CHAT domain-containing protein [Alphaproteobacteria bacterium]|nr:CHAT domain-containing protein [Alphaproteobacteria bacterium]